MIKYTNSPRRLALHDISQWMIDSEIEIIKNGDIWVVTATRLDCPEQRRLNRELGIRGINLIGNTNGKPKKINHHENR